LREELPIPVTPGAVPAAAVQEVDRIAQTVLVGIAKAVILDFGEFGHGGLLSTFTERSKWKSSQFRLEFVPANRTIASKKPENLGRGDLDMWNG